MTMQETKTENEIITTKIFSYGIIRKQSFAVSLIREFGLDSVKMNPDMIQGYVPYSSNGINMVYPVTQKQKDKHPNAEFLVEGTILTFKGEKENIEKLHQYLDLIESGYKKTVTPTVKGENVWLYYMENEKKKCYHLDGIGLIIYDDTVTEQRTYLNPDTIPDNVTIKGN